MLLDQFLNFRNLLWLEAEVRRQLDGRIDPELRFAVSMLNMNVRSPFLAGKEIGRALIPGVSLLPLRNVRPASAKSSAAR